MKNIPIFALLLLAFTLFACNKHTGTEALLSKVELQMDEHPDSALILLQELDTKQLTSADEKALYAGDDNCGFVEIDSDNKTLNSLFNF